MPTFPDPILKSLGGDTAASLPQVPLPFLAQVAKLVTVGSAWLASEAYTDNTFSVPCADGNLIYGLRDVAGGLFPAVSATVAQQPTYRSKAFNGLPAADYTADSARILTATNSFTGAGFAAGFSIYCVAQPAAVSPGNTVIWLKDGNNFITTEHVDNTTAYIRGKINGNQFEFNHVCGNGGTALVETLGVYHIATDGTNIRVGVNGCYITGTITPFSPPTTGSTSLGNLAGSPPSLGLTGTLAACLQCPGFHSVSLMNQITALLVQQFNIPGSMVFVGDSITYGYGLNIPTEQSWPSQLVKMMGGVNGQNVALINLGVPGDTIEQMIAECASPDQRQLYASSARGQFNTVFIMAGTNSMSSDGGHPNESAAVAFAALKTLAAFYRPLCRWLYIVTCIPRKAADAGAGFEAKRLTFNASIMADSTMQADGKIDVGGDAAFVLGLAGAGLYQTDDVRPNDGGCARLAWLGAQAIAANRDTSGIFLPLVSQSPALSSARIVGAGTAYSLTTSLASVAFGTTSPTLILPPGTYQLVGGLSFSGGTVADNIQGRFYNSTAAAAIGTTHNDTVNLAVGTNLADMVMMDTVTLTVTSAVTMQAANATGARGTVVAASTYLTATQVRPF